MDELFSEETVELYKLCWLLHITHELELDRMRSDLKNREFFDAYSCFLACDLTSDGFIDSDELRELFRREKVPGIKESDVLLLIERYNSKPDKSGRVTYSEFINELRPKF